VFSYIKKRESLASQSRYLLDLINILYLIGCFYLVLIGSIIAVTNGLTYGIQIFPYIPALSYSMILYGIFGLILYTRFNWQSAFVLGGIYSIWDLIQQPGVYIGAHSLVVKYEAFWQAYVIWFALILVMFLLVKPRVQFQFMPTVILFFFYAEIVPFWSGDARGFISELVWFYFVWSSVYPRK
jgi:hypothetical protein